MKLLMVLAIAFWGVSGLAQKGDKGSFEWDNFSCDVISKKILTARGKTSEAKPLCVLKAQCYRDNMGEVTYEFEIDGLCDESSCQGNPPAKCFSEQTFREIPNDNMGTATGTSVNGEAAQ